MKQVLVPLFAVVLLLPPGVDVAEAKSVPNFVVIFIDDMGYGDIGETKNVAAENPEVVQRLKGYMDAFETEIRNRSRPVGVAQDPRTLLPRPGVVGEEAFAPTLSLKRK
jgi:hypothetical protein